jgi:hypothetical protein
MKRRLITEIPDEIDATQQWHVEYWAQALGVSAQRIRQCIPLVGPRASNIRAFLAKGHRIALEDTSGTLRLVARITNLSDGFSLLVPYHPAKEGCLFKVPIDYACTRAVVAPSETYSVSDVVKLSLHMSGFVQFSTGGQKPIVSGYCNVLKRPKGIGLRAADLIEVTSGPLCGVMVQGLESFEPLGSNTAEIFNRGDLWFHPEFPEETGAYNIEIFMLPLDVLLSATMVDGKRTVNLELPFAGKVKFRHILRVIELPKLWFALGVIISPLPGDSTIDSGYKIASPGMFDPNGQAFAITGWFPRAEMLKDEEMKSLDFGSK